MKIETEPTELVKRYPRTATYLVACAALSLFLQVATIAILVL